MFRFKAHILDSALQLKNAPLLFLSVCKSRSLGHL